MSLNGIKGKIDNMISLLTTDTKLRFCTQGRDMSQIVGGARDSAKTEARYPHLLDNFVVTIINAGKTKAAANYDKKFNELYAQAIKDQSAEIAQISCAAIAGGFDKNKISLFSESKSYADPSVTSITISGVKLADMMSMTAQSQDKASFIMTDRFNNMVARVNVSSIFTPGTRSCTINKTTIACKGQEAVYNTMVTDTTYEDSSWFGADVDTSYNVVTNTNFTGTICAEYMPPVEHTQTIQM
jgi:hypothetical protein